MIPNNPSGPDQGPNGEITSKNIEIPGLSPEASNKLVKSQLADLKGELGKELSHNKLSETVSAAFEEEHPGEDNHEKISLAISMLKEYEQQYAQEKIEQGEKFKSKRASLAENIDIPLNKTQQSFTKNIRTETTDFIEGSLSSIKITGIFAKNIATDFIQATKVLLTNPGEIPRYLVAKADGIYKEPQALANNTINT